MQKKNRPVEIRRNVIEAYWNINIKAVLPKTKLLYFYSEIKNCGNHTFVNFNLF